MDRYSEMEKKVVRLTWRVKKRSYSQQCCYILSSKVGYHNRIKWLITNIIITLSDEYLLEPVLVMFNVYKKVPPDASNKKSLKSSQTNRHINIIYSSSRRWWLRQYFNNINKECVSLIPLSQHGLTWCYSQP